MPFPSCCEASPARPRRGSSSPRPWVAGFSSGMPVSEAMVDNGGSRAVMKGGRARGQGGLDYKWKCQDLAGFISGAYVLETPMHSIDGLGQSHSKL